MYKPFLFLCLYCAPFLLFAQEQAEVEIPEPTIESVLEKALLITIKGRLLSNSGEVWNTEFQKITIPGRSITFEVKGEDLKLVTTLTPHLPKENDYVLTAQSQLWIIKNGRSSYKAIMRSMSIKMGEVIYYLPLGRPQKGESPMEIQIIINPYRPKE